LLNETQKIFFGECLDWYEADERHRTNPDECPEIDPLLIVLTGAAGTGKSFLINQVIKKIAKNGVFRCCAPTGVAATNLPEGFTIHSLFAYSSSRSYAVGDAATRDASIVFGRDVRFVVIDEFSMMESRMLSHINLKLQEWCGNKRTFGGVSIILMGDPFQLFPVGSSLIGASCERDNEAGALFRMFRRIDLMKQERSGDEAHTTRLKYFREPTDVARPVAESGMLGCLKTLSENDAAMDPKWKRATIVVAGNEQRVQINLARAISFAKETGQPVIAWRLPINESKMKNLVIGGHVAGKNIKEALSKFQELSFYFVKGAPAIVKENINTTLRLANGTRCVLHSLTLNQDTADEHWINIANCRPGQIYWLPEDDLPVSVNVHVPSLKSATWDSNFTLIQDAVVIPLTLVDNGDAKIAKTGRLKKAGVKIRSYWIDLAFAVTFFKVQGSTEERVIIDFNCAGGNQKDVDLPSFYVGVSRVRHGDHMRILPISSQTRDHLLNLKFSKALLRWNEISNRA
jgi:hypothetical protein